ncbi:hypothetical protein BEP19_13730 [Ammoniphilus oxalaticus]|uniref:Uncharacterized protein n=1 Tax=Ammoniphilus oxalaticus TaxID=66863 RepID=A0A419SEH5_9BACL|nr:hypothetical protein [Ammoniphilus oxalaticus]RKD21691.1 hypothetical protein BEP19_13730 [Ammoniphilus oxalaticus]
MQRGRLMILLGGAFTLLGLFAMPMKRVNPRQNLVDNPFGWGLFGFGLASLLMGISAISNMKTQDYEDEEEDGPAIDHPSKRIEVKQGVMKRLEH